jgi:hypothetical protein
MDQEALQEWILNALEIAEQEGELDLEDINSGEAGITVETVEGTYLIKVQEV